MTGKKHKRAKMCLLNATSDAANDSNHATTSQLPTATPKIAGLPNIGNSCYMGSVLQVFLYLNFSEKLDMRLKEALESPSISEEKLITTAPFTYQFCNLSRAAFRSRKKCVKDIRQTMEDMEKFYGEEQEDAHEFLLFVLDCFQKEMEKLQKLVYPDKPIDDVIEEDFLFKVEKTFVCSQCDYENVVNEKETHLILQLANSSAEEPSIIGLLNDALEGTTDQFLCPMCSVKLSIKKCQMVRLPRYFILVAMRYFFDTETASSSKITSPIIVDQTFNVLPWKCQASSGDNSFDQMAVVFSPGSGIEDLRICDASDQMSDPSDCCASISSLETVALIPEDSLNQRKEMTHYKMRAIVNHKGGSTSRGHYTTLLKTQSNGWMRCNDSVIRKVKESSAFDECKQSGYIFFYERADTHASHSDSSRTSSMSDVPKINSPVSNNNPSSRTETPTKQSLTDVENVSVHTPLCRTRDSNNSHNTEESDEEEEVEMSTLYSNDSNDNEDFFKQGHVKY
ncbi:ubiquitin carboxyl-terminal hydrolase domain-containing protein [Ditylenchus destructor]|nr:ubiquitin carboxyl-terminal hydrolase domain-containing protein [Ditylenchus destructor]